jgi:Trk-type K+ transport system membrane component
VIFYLIEKNYVMEGMTFWEKFTTSFFMSVTPRTAGFNSFDMSALRPITITWMLLFMWIGASPMSAGGGIKTTTLGISILTIWNTLRGRDYIEIRGRRISQQTINRSYIIIFVSLVVIGIGTGALLLTEPTMSLQEAAFHVTSAFGSVGLALTSEYAVSTKIILIIIMFIGRIGLITILMCLIPAKQISSYKYPTETISIN